MSMKFYTVALLVQPPPNTACTHTGCWGFCGISSIFLASGFFCSQTESTPAHCPRTQALGGFVQNTGRWGFCGTYGKHFAHAWLRVFFCSQAESMPAHCPRTETVGRRQDISNAEAYMNFFQYRLIDTAGSEIGIISDSRPSIRLGERVQLPDGSSGKVVDIYDDEDGKEGGVQATLAVE